MQREDAIIITTFGIEAGIFGVCLLVWYNILGYRGDPQMIDGADTALEDEEFEKMRRARDKTISLYDTQHYLMVLKQLCWMFMVMSIVGLLVNLPYYIYINYHYLGVSAERIPKVNLISVYAWTTAEPPPSSLYILTATSLIQALIAICSLKQLRQDLSNVEHDSEEGTYYCPRTSTRPETYHICLDGLQSQIVKECTIVGVFASLYPNQVLCSSIVFDYSQLYDQKRHLEKAERELTRIFGNESTAHIENLTESLIPWTAPPVQSIQDPILALVHDLRGGNMKAVSPSLNRYISARGSPRGLTDSPTKSDQGVQLHTPYKHQKSQDQVTHFQDSRKLVERIQFKTDEEKSKYRWMLESWIPNANVGKAFVAFYHSDTVRNAITFQHRQFFHSWGWHLSEAPPPEDILWSNIHVRANERRFRLVVCVTILVLLCSLMGIFASALDVYIPQIMFKNLMDPLPKYIIFTLTGLVSPTIYLFLNSILFPALIWNSAKYTMHWLWSSFQSHILHSNALLGFINLILVPISGNEYLMSRKLHWTVWPILDSFYIRYMFSVIFLSSSSQLLQLPRRQWASILDSFNYNNEAIERWQFDFGYWYSFLVSVTFIGGSLCVPCPVLLPLVAVFFYVKYMIEKYNFKVGIWTVDTHDSKGRIADVALRYVVASVVINMCLVSIFSIGYIINRSDMVFVEHDVKWDPKDDINIRGLFFYYNQYTSNLMRNIWQSSMELLRNEPVIIANLALLSVAVVIMWSDVLRWRNPARTVFIMLIRVYYLVRKAILGADVQYYNHCTHYDISQHPHLWKKEDYLPSDASCLFESDLEKIKRAYVHPVMKN